jgi:hypothetical protein
MFEAGKLWLGLAIGAVVVVACLFLLGPAGHVRSAELEERASSLVRPKKPEPPPAVREFRTELARATALDQGRQVKEAVGRLKEDERRLELRVQRANRELNLEDFFASDPDAVFYEDDWRELSGKHAARTRAQLEVLTRWLDEVAAGEAGQILPEAAGQIVREVQRRIGEIQEHLSELGGRLKIISRLAQDTRRSQAQPARAPAAPVRAVPVSHHGAAEEQEERTERPRGRDIPSWSVTTRNLLERYQRR